MGGPRVRFAPSPTGYFHVGSARTALFNWFVARQASDGVFLLRVEDTDASRNRPEWVEAITQSLAWLGLSVDEGPFFQSENGAAHEAAAQLLRRRGYLYYCDCSAETLASRKVPGAPPGYDGFCRERGLERGATTALRFATPHEGATIVEDVIRGAVTFEHERLDDFVVAKSSGAALYNLANVVDDRHDRITHVIRGEDQLANTPKQILLWRALDAATDDVVALPLYAHLPLLVNEQRKKLSKRKDPVSTESYRDQGYLPAAFVNYLALLGWSPRGDAEKVPVATLLSEFRLEDVAHSPAFFDVKKLRHLNGEYLRELSVADFVRASTPWVRPWVSEWCPTDYEAPWSREQFDGSLFARVAPLIQERVATLADVPAMIAFFFVEPTIDDALFDTTVRHDPFARLILAEVLHQSELLVEWRAADIQRVIVEAGEHHGQALRRAQAPVRLAVTGSLVGPPLFESLELLGRQRSVARLRATLARVA